MNLYDLFEDIIPQVTGQDYMSRRAELSKASNKIGSGFYGAVYPNTQSSSGQETALKVTSFHEDDPELDGYFAYISKLKKFIDRYHNPYLPQIHDVKIVNPSSKKPYLEVDMEKLVPLNSLNINDFVLLLEKILQHKFQSTEQLDSFVLGDPDFGPTDKHDIAVKIVRLASMTMRDPNYQSMGIRIQDKNMLDALRIIANLIKKGYKDDLHPGNLMARRTKYGPQLVFTDPLSWMVNVKLKFID